MKSRGSSIRLHLPDWCKSLLWLFSALPSGIVCATPLSEFPQPTKEPSTSLTTPSAQATGEREAILEREILTLRGGNARPEKENEEASTTPSQTQEQDSKPLTGGVQLTENLPTGEQALSLPTVSGMYADGVESPVAPQTPLPEIRTAPTEDPVVPPLPCVTTPVNVLPAPPGGQAEGTETPDVTQTPAPAAVPVTRPSSAPAPANTVPVARGKMTDCAGPVAVLQPAVAPSEVSVTPPVQEQLDDTPQKVTPAETALAATEETVDGAEVPAMPRASLATSEIPAAPAEVAGTPVLRTVQTDKTPSPAPAEKVVPRTLSEEEQNSYVVGMMVADYARSVLLTLDKLDVSPDERLFLEGLQDALSGKPLLNSSDVQAAMQRIQKQADRRQAELDAASRQALVDIAEKHNTVEKKEDRVWVRLKKGGPAVSKQTPLSLSWEGQIYNGAVFESVTDAAVTRREVLPSWLQRAIRLAGPGGEVRLFILAGSLEGEAPLPAGTGRHELVQYTVSVKKAKP